MLSYVLLIAVMSLVVTIILTKFPRLSLVRVPVSQRRHSHLHNS
jgi:hypothetical protein